MTSARSTLPQFLSRIAITVIFVSAACAEHQPQAAHPNHGRQALSTNAATAAKGHYASVNGLRMYYEIHGSGRPMLLLHGSMNTIESAFSSVLPYFASSRQVIAVEQQAHGHTADIDRPLTFEQMADDTATLLERLGLQSVDVFGYSTGGTVALQIAIRHPNHVRKLVLASAIYALDGYQPDITESLRHITAETMPAAMREA
jgi:pimeloyl-ACP methyl ester carboxylesterase